MRKPANHRFLASLLATLLASNLLVVPPAEAIRPFAAPCFSHEAFAVVSISSNHPVAIKAKLWLIRLLRPIWENQNHGARQENETEEPAPETVTQIRDLTKDHLIKTPLIEVPALAEDLQRKLSRPGMQVFVKYEPNQETGSYKPRGVLADVLLQAEAYIKAHGDLRNVVWVTESTGNHGKALAWAVRVVLPRIYPSLRYWGQVEIHVPGEPPIPVAKREALEELKVKVIDGALGDDGQWRPFGSYGEARAEVMKKKNGNDPSDTERPFYIHVEHDSPNVMAGHGGILLEIVEQLKERGLLDNDGFLRRPITVVVPAGSFGMVSGIALAAQTLVGHKIRVVAAQSEGVRGGIESLFLDTVVPNAPLNGKVLLEDGTAVDQIGARALRLFRHYGNAGVIVRDIAHGVRRLYEAIKDQTDERSFEGSVGNAVQVLYEKPQAVDSPDGTHQAEIVVLILSGGNTDQAQWAKAKWVDEAQSLVVRTIAGFFSIFRTSVSRLRFTMPHRTGRFGNPKPAIDAEEMRPEEITESLEQKRIVYGVPAPIARQFVGRVSGSDSDLYALRENANGRLVAARKEHDEFLRIYRFSSDGEIRERLWGASLSDEQFSLLESAFREAFRAHINDIRGVHPDAIRHFLDQYWTWLNLEIRGTHDYLGEPSLPGEMTGTIIVDEALISVDNYSVLLATLIDEIGHLLTLQNDEENTPNTLRILATHMYKSMFQHDLSATLSDLYSVVRYVAGCELPPPLKEALFPDFTITPGLNTGLEISRYLEDLAPRLASFLLETRGDANLSSNGPKRRTMPGRARDNEKSRWWLPKWLQNLVGSEKHGEMPEEPLASNPSTPEKPVSSQPKQPNVSKSWQRLEEAIKRYVHLVRQGGVNSIVLNYDIRELSEASLYKSAVFDLIRLVENDDIPDDVKFVALVLIASAPEESQSELVSRVKYLSLLLETGRSNAALGWLAERILTHANLPPEQFMPSAQSIFGAGNISSDLRDLLRSDDSHSPFNPENPDSFYRAGSPIELLQTAQTSDPDVSKWVYSGLKKPLMGPGRKLGKTKGFDVEKYFSRSRDETLRPSAGRARGGSRARRPNASEDSRTEGDAESDNGPDDYGSYSAIDDLNVLEEDVQQDPDGDDGATAEPPSESRMLDWTTALERWRGWIANFFSLRFFFAHVIATPSTPHPEEQQRRGAQRSLAFAA